MKNHHKKLSRLGTILVVSVSLLAQLFAPALAHAAGQITTRSLTLVANGTVGGSTIGGVVNHLFNFTEPTNASVGSIQFLYCTTASGACIMPTGLNTTTATIGSQSGATGFSIVDTTNGSPYLTRTAASLGGGVPLAYQLNGITNPTTANGVTFYVRISTFASTDTTGVAIDAGNVAASTATQIVVTGQMPESLVFCTGGTISTTSGVPDCSTATSGAVGFNQLFSPTDTATAVSQMAASTNAGSGYVITVNGTTLTSGGNTIAGMSLPGTTTHGIAQFGLNLKANTTATSTIAVGSEISPASDGLTYRGEATPSSGYDTVDTFKFHPGDTIADSADGGAGGSNAQIYTVSYIANVPGSQPAGTYTATLTYICTPTY